MHETVVLTCISGFIAKHIAIKLLNAGYVVRGSLRDLARADDVRRALAPQADLTHLSFVQLDLTKNDNWVEAMEGATALIHTASPFPIAPPKHDDELILPAVEGTLRAVTAAYAAGIRRAIVPELWRIFQVSNARTRSALDLRFISCAGALRATADWLIANAKI